MALLIPFCKPVGIDYFPLIDKLFFLWKLAALGYLVLAVAQHIRFDFKHWKTADDQRKLIGTLGLGLFWLIYFVGCLTVGVDIVSVGTDAVGCALLLVFITGQIRTGRGQKLLHAMAMLFGVYIVLYVLSVVLVRLGWMRFSDTEPHTVYQFGYDNYSAFFLYPMLSVVLFYRHIRFGKIDVVGYGLTAMLVLCYLLTASMTAAGAGVLMVVLLLTREHWKRFYWIMDVKWLLVAMTVFLVMICVFQVQNLLAFLLDAMQKGVTLNSRTHIWDQALKLIADKPIFGYGAFTKQQIDSLVLYGTTHAHNLLLDLLLRAGAVGTAGYLLFLCMAVPSRRLKDKVNTEGYILLIGLLIQLVLFTMDFYPNIYVFYCFMAVLYNSDLLLAPKKDGELPEMEENH
jgi:O-antigen ligase